MFVIVNKILINYKINTMLKNVLSQLLLCFNFVRFIIVLIDGTIHIQNVIAGFYILKLLTKLKTDNILRIYVICREIVG